MGSNGNDAARGHHFLSQCYLKGFTQLGTKESKLVTLNLTDRKSFSTIPKNVAKERDFNRVDFDGLSPNHLESQLAFFEDTANEAIQNVERTGIFEGDDRIVILNLMALFILRNPYRREYWNYIQDHTMKIMLSMAAANVGGTTNGVLITEDFKKFVDEGNFKVEPHQNEQIKLELSALDPVIDSLIRRKWTLVHAKDDLTFITCDRPVPLMWKEDKQYVASPGFGLPETLVCFPLTKKLAIVGEFEGEDCVITAPERLMGSINSSIFTHAALWVYTETGNFIFLKHNGELSYGLSAFWEYLGLLIDAA